MYLRDLLGYPGIPFAAPQVFQHLWLQHQLEGLAKDVAHPHFFLQVDHDQVCLSHNNPMFRKKTLHAVTSPTFWQAGKTKTRITKVQRVRDIGKVKEQLKPHPQQKIMAGGLRPRVLHHFIHLCIYYI